VQIETEYIELKRLPTKWHIACPTQTRGGLCKGAAAATETINIKKCDRNNRSKHCSAGVGLCNKTEKGTHRGTTSTKTKSHQSVIRIRIRAA